MINKKLAKKMNIGYNTQFTIEILQNRLEQYCKRPSLFFTSPVETVNIIRSYEYVLQTLWNFEPNSNWHSYWYNINGCTCAKLDNRELMGHNLNYINGDCIFHGIELEYWPK